MNLRFPFSAYIPGRFASLAREHFAREMWHFLADDDTIRIMIQAASENLPPIKPLLEIIESRWAEILGDSAFAESEVDVFVNNQIKQIMELCGYENIGCRKIPEARFIRLSGLYEIKTV
jgi:hypothetical protein